jgi:hypothetical protein
VSETSTISSGKVIAFAAVVEVVTGLALMIDPAIVVTLLLDVDITGPGAPLARCFGIALVALGLACWPSRTSPGSALPAFRAMLIYNALIALYLAYLYTAGYRGVLLWPAVVLHAVVALLLIWMVRDERRTRANTK